MYGSQYSDLYSTTKNQTPPKLDLKLLASDVICILSQCVTQSSFTECCNTKN